MNFGTLHRIFLNIIVLVDVLDIRAMKVGASSIMETNLAHRSAALKYMGVVFMLHSNVSIKSQMKR